MTPLQYLCYNGENLKADAPVLSAANRAFRYGDGLFETIRCIQQQPMFFEDHYKRALNSMALLKMQTQSLPPMDVLRRQIGALLAKNRIFGDGRVRLTLFREDGGLYTPESNRVSYLIEVVALKTVHYPLNTRGLLIGLYPDDVKALNRFAHFKSANALLYVMAGLYRKEMQLDEVLILNEERKIIETMASNLFWIKNHRIYTPRRSSGCVDGVMRRQLIRLLKDKGQPVVEVEGTDIAELSVADEIFISNAIQGIQWVVGLDQKRYFCNKVKEIHTLLQEHVTNYLTGSQES